jgi:hypothetical protein
VWTDQNVHYTYNNNGFVQRLSCVDPDPTIDSEESLVSTDGMKPFDIPTCVFGFTLALSELEEALKENGYDFDMGLVNGIQVVPDKESRGKK